MCVVYWESCVSFLSPAQDALSPGSRARDGGGVAGSLTASCPLLCAASAPGSPTLTLAGWQVRRMGLCFHTALLGFLVPCRWQGCLLWDLLRVYCLFLYAKTRC